MLVRTDIKLNKALMALKPMSPRMVNKYTGPKACSLVADAIAKNKIKHQDEGIKYQINSSQIVTYKGHRRVRTWS
jgi:hypothetical protein